MDITTYLGRLVWQPVLGVSSTYRVFDVVGVGFVYMFFCLTQIVQTNLQTSQLIFGRTNLTAHYREPM